MKNYMFNRLSHSTLLQSATIFAVLVAAVLVCGKFFAYNLTHSLSIEASLFDSILDGGISMINFFAIRHALAPPDDCHRFGHGKVEALVGFLQSLLIAGSSFWLFKQVVQQFLNPEPLVFHTTAVFVMSGAIVLTAILVTWQTYVIKKTNSIALAADALHYKTDLLTNIGVLISFLITHHFHWYLVDLVVALVVCVYILKTSYEIGQESFDILMDRELPDEIVSQLKEVAQLHPMVRGVHDLRTRSSGQRKFVQMHLDVDGHLPLFDAHEIAEEIELKIIEIFPDIDVIIHQDPIRL